MRKCSVCINSSCAPLSHKCEYHNISGIKKSVILTYWNISESIPAELFHDDSPTGLTNVLFLKKVKTRMNSLREYFFLSCYIQNFDNMGLNNHHYFSPEPTCIGFWLSIVCELYPEHYKKVQI